jgi:hypothetical protein
MPQAIKSDSRDDYESDYDLLHIVRPAHELRSVSQEGHDQGANDGTKRRSLAAVKATPSNHHRRNRVQLSADVHRGISNAEPCKLYYTRKAEK